MNKKITLLAIVAWSCASGALNAFAYTYYLWNSSGSGGWRSAQQYLLRLEDGTAAAQNAPSSDSDIVIVPEGVRVAVSTDEEAAFVNGLGGVKLEAESSIFVFNQPSEIKWECPLFGEGSIIKSTSATVEFLPNTQTDLNSKKFSGYSAYLTWGGLIVEKGTVKMPQGDSNIYSFGPVVLSNDTVFVLSPRSTSQIAALNGYGMVTSPAPVSAKQNLQVGYQSWDSPKWNVSHFYGVLAGEGMKWSSPGTVYLYNQESWITGNIVHWGRFDETHPWGFLCLPKFGMAGQPSPIGTFGTIELRTSGSIRYFGEGETTDKIVYWRTQEPAPVVIDAGDCGGVVFTGNWSQYSDLTKDSENRMGRLVLTGNNAIPCVIEGRISTPQSFNGTNYTSYITKKGTGTWRFANDTNRQKGALAIADGTLQFTSIAEKGKDSALGSSSLLYEDVFGLRDENRKVDYAFLLGDAQAYPTFEFVGGDIASCSTRPLALTGTGGRLSSSGNGSQLSFSGVYSENAGEKKLTLGGDSSGHNVISGIAPGKGSVSLAKDGSGRWILRGANTLSGTLDVRGGRLELWDGYAPTYYRLVIKSVSDPKSTPFALEFSMYDSAGSNRVAGLKYRMTTVEGSEYGYPEPVSALAEGEALYCSAAGCKIYNKQGYTLEKLFDGSTGMWRMFAENANNMPPKEEDDPAKYIYVVMRLPSDTPPLVRYDMVTGTQNDNSITRFAIECSSDGENWMPLTDDVSVEELSINWLSDGSKFEGGHPYRKDCGLKLKDTFSKGDDGAESVLEGVESLRVAPGATLAALGKRKTVSSLVVDCSSGVGKITGIDFAPDGVIELVNLPQSDDRDLVLEADLSGLSAESLRNLNAYEVKVAGADRKKMLVRVSASSVTVSKVGLVFVVR